MVVRRGKSDELQLYTGKQCGSFTACELLNFIWDHKFPAVWKCSHASTSRSNDTDLASCTCLYYKGSVSHVVTIFFFFLAVISRPVISTDLTDVTVFGTLTTVGLGLLPLWGVLLNKRRADGKYFPAPTRQWRLSGAVAECSYCESEKRPVQCLVTVSYSRPPPSSFLCGAQLDRPRWRNWSRIREFLLLQIYANSHDYNEL